MPSATPICRSSRRSASPIVSWCSRSRSSSTAFISSSIRNCGGVDREPALPLSAFRPGHGGARHRGRHPRLRAVCAMAGAERSQRAGPAPHSHSAGLDGRRRCRVSARHRQPRPLHAVAAPLRRAHGHDGRGSRLARRDDDRIDPGACCGLFRRAGGLDHRPHRRCVDVVPAGHSLAHTHGRPRDRARQGHSRDRAGRLDALLPGVAQRGAGGQATRIRRRRAAHRLLALADRDARGAARDIAAADHPAEPGNGDRGGGRGDPVVRRPRRRPQPGGLGADDRRCAPAYLHLGGRAVLSGAGDLRDRHRLQPAGRRAAARARRAPDQRGRTMSTLLSIRDLGVSARIAGATVPVIRGLSFELEPSRILGLVGESGAGKSMVGRAIAQMLPPGFAISAGACIFRGVDLVQAGAAARRALLGRDLAFIPQSPQTALDPLQTVGQQFDEHFRHADAALSKAERSARALTMLAAVHLPDGEQLLDKYPHQLSGGMCQRVLIAMAFASNPRLVIADEPTTALDVTIQVRMLRLIAEMQERYRTALIFITHDLRLATHICDEIMVMYAGSAVELGPGRAVFSTPAHPYTRCLQLAEPSISNQAHAPLVLPEQMPGLIELERMSGCHFAPRCPIARDECRHTRPALTQLRPGHSAACLRMSATPEIMAPEPLPSLTLPRLRGRVGEGAAAAEGAPLLRVEGLSKRYSMRGMLFARSELVAVKNVGFSIAENEFVALVGESGSGKSTIARLLVGLEQPSAGRILINGRNVTDASRDAQALRIATVQMVFQDPQSALNPQRRVASIVTQAMEAGSRHASWEERLERTRQLLAEVGMSPDLAGRYPPQLSGGQRQRVNIARALCTKARLLVADEIVSGLDVSVQAQLLSLLMRLRSELGFAMLFISHDLSVVRYLCGRVLTMYRGEIIEHGRTDEVFANPTYPYTRALLSAVPPEDPNARWTALTTPADAE